MTRPTFAKVHTDAAELRAFTRDNLDTYWRGISEQLHAATAEEIGAQEYATTWSVLGVARLHHLLATGELTSKSGAGRYIVERLPRQWVQVGREALRLREDPTSAGEYASPTDRGSDTRDFVDWAIADGLTYDA